MSSVTLQGIEKNYGSVPVLRGIDLNIEPGEFTVLVGPSGCGKSTLLRMVAGLEEITRGDIHIGSRRVNDLEPRERDIAMVFQSYALYPHMSVAENMSFALRLAKQSSAEIARRVESAARMLGLMPLLDRYPRQLSGGQRQRVAMGRAIVRSPQVFLFDEPLSNLDAKLRVQMRADIKDLHQQLRTTSIYVTHDQIEAMTMADKIVVMHDGRIEQVGTPLQLYDDPANKFVAGFIGSPAMNFVPVEVKGQRLHLSDHQSVPAPFTLAEGRRLELGVRPEQFEVRDDGLRARVRVIEPTGADTLIVADLAGTEIVVAIRQRSTAQPGDMLGLRAGAGAVILFDVQTGVRVRADAST